MPRPLPIGISDFREIIKNGFAYVDKSLFIEELIEKHVKVALIPRWRRSGKTLNLSMLRYFFEKQPEDTSYLFKNLKIWKKEKYRERQGNYPVIFITLKDEKHSSWEEAFISFSWLMAAEFERHRYLLETDHLSDEEKEQYRKILRKEQDKPLIEKSLLLLSKWLSRYHSRGVVLLIDEYDTPVHAAFVGGYYNLWINFLRNWLSAGLKDNIHLERGVLTGILRTAKESIFSGLNNISTFTLLNDSFSDKFGLIESEVIELLEEYDLASKLPDFRKWYNGYRSGSSTNIYNPWSVLNCILNKGALAPYWINTSENTLIKQLITQGSDIFKRDIEQLLKGGTIEKKIDDGVVFSELHQSSIAIWSLLLYCGYLTLDAAPSYGVPCQLRIPNIEVAGLYKSLILNWFEQSIHEHKYHMMLNSLVKGEIDIFSQIFQEFMFSSVSVFDVPSDESEKIYHGFVLGLLIGLNDRYEVKSNRESGLGRYDVMIIPKNSNDLGLIMEFKKVGRFEKITLEEAVESALKQIEERQYAQELSDRGVKRILYLGFAFEGKKVLIRSKLRL